MINYNGKLIREESSNLNAFNRGLAFGDGLFESMIYSANTIQLYDLHWERLKNGLNLLGIHFKPAKNDLQQQIIRLLAEHGRQASSCRIKLIVWRSGAGKYTPEENNSEYLISATPYSLTSSEAVIQCELSDQVKLIPSSYSHLKTLSALPYVMAARERDAKGLGELLLLNDQGHIAEASSSNIFVFNQQEKRYSTPPLSDGCIDGVMRKYLIKNLKQKGMHVVERSISPKELNNNTTLLLTNVSGIRQVSYFQGIKLGEETEPLKALQLLIQ